MTNDEWLKISEVTRLLRVSQQTLRRWDKAGKIETSRLPSGRRIFNHQSVLACLGQNTPDQENQKILYARVSSPHQKDDLQRQIDFLQSRYPDYKVVSDVGSGINFKRKGLQTILEFSMRGQLEEVVVAHRDRLSRIAFDLIQWIIQTNRGKLTVLDQEESQSPEKELANDLLSIVTVFSCRQMGRRKYKRENKSSEDNSLSESRTEKDNKTMDGDC